MSHYSMVFLSVISIVVSRPHSQERFPNTQILYSINIELMKVYQETLYLLYRVRQVQVLILVSTLKWWNHSHWNALMINHIEATLSLLQQPIAHATMSHSTWSIHTVQPMVQDQMTSVELFLRIHLHKISLTVLWKVSQETLISALQHQKRLIIQLLLVEKATLIHMMIEEAVVPIILIT